MKKSFQFSHSGLFYKVYLHLHNLHLHIFNINCLERVIRFSPPSSLHLPGSVRLQLLFPSLPLSPYSPTPSNSLHLYCLLHPSICPHFSSPLHLPFHSSLLPLLSFLCTYFRPPPPVLSIPLPLLRPSPPPPSLVRPAHLERGERVRWPPSHPIANPPASSTFDALPPPSRPSHSSVLATLPPPPPLPAVVNPRPNGFRPHVLRA